MPNQDLVRGRGATPVRTPDQLQQSRRPDESQPAVSAGQFYKKERRRIQDEGVLGQLKTERAHD